MLTGPVVHEHECRLPNFLRRHPVNLFGMLRRKLRGDFAEPLEDRLARNFHAVFSS